MHLKEEAFERMTVHGPFEFSTDAISLGINIKRYLIKPFLKKNLKVHSVYHNVINLESDIGLLSLVTPEIGRMATYVVVSPIEGVDFLTMELKPESKCIVEGNKLIFDKKLSVNFKAAEEWQGILDKGYRWKVEELKEENISALRAALHIYGEKNSAYKRIYENKEKQIIEAVEKFNFKNSKSIISSAVYSLIGLGPGLTPTGDDVLTGVLSVITSCSERKEAEKFIIDGIYENLYRTNYISGNMLINSTRNIYHQYIQELIFAVGSETPEKVMEASKSLMKIGATSGSDIAAGIYIGFVNVLEYF